MASRGRGRRGRPRGASQAPLIFYQQAFVEAIGIVVAAIAQASAAGSQGGPSNLQRFKVHHPLLTIEGGVDDIRDIQDMGASTKRKEDPFYSNPGKKQKTFVLHGSQGQSQGHQDQGQDRAFSEAGQMICYLCRQPGHFRLDCPRRKKSPKLWDTSVPIISGTSQGCQSGRADGVLPLPAARAHEEGLPPRTGIPGFWDSTVPVGCRTRADTVHSSVS